MSKLNWQVKMDGVKFLRRKLPGDILLDLDYIDVEWTHEDGFPPDTKEVPVTHPPDIRFETVVVGQRTVIQDQVSVSSGTSDATVAMMLDEKRGKLAKSLNVEP